MAGPAGGGVGEGELLPTAPGGAPGLAALPGGVAAAGARVPREGCAVVLAALPLDGGRAGVADDDDPALVIRLWTVVTGVGPVLLAEDLPQNKARWLGFE